MKKIAILGSTGSIGTQTLELVRDLKQFQVMSISAGKNISLLEKQIEEFKPKCVCVQNETDALNLSKKFKNIEFFHGNDGLYKITKYGEHDLVINAVSGFTGIYISLASIESDKTLLLANKESIVCGSQFLMNLSKEKICFSLIKRLLNVKDFRNIIPGHGGVLDRFDSIIFLSPFVLIFIHIIKLVG